MISSRDKILDRLGRYVRPFEAGHGAPPPAPVDEGSDIARFTAALEAVGGKVMRCPLEQLGVMLSEVIPLRDRVYIEPDPFLAGIAHPGLSIGKDPAGCDSAITTCEALIAETGTVILSGGKNQQRISSLVTRAHYVVARPDQCVPTLDRFLNTLTHADPTWHEQCSVLTFITGPSRTADIEKVLIRGMHGPKELVVVIIQEKIG